MNTTIPNLPRWIIMWLIAGVMFFSVKFLVWRRVAKHSSGINLGRFFLFMLFWPDMEAEVFVRGPGKVRKPRASEWSAAVLKMTFGFVMVWVIARKFTANMPLLAGWIGLIGCVFILHFGLFHLVALIWQRLGFPVKPIMRSPILAQSLGEFWSQRWNLAFSRLAHDFVFMPLRRRWGIAGATMAVFAVSGILHDVVISIPSMGGYGLPTAYFLIQGFGALFERSRFGRALGLGRNWKGRVFTMIITIVPVGWLYQPVFIDNVILPMLRGIGAI